MKVNHISILLIIIFIHYSSGTNDYTLNGADWADGSCSSGIRQSPINIDTGYLILENDDISITAMADDISSGTIGNEAGALDELKCNYTGGNVTYSSRNETAQFNLLQFHFHAPAEHTINNQTFDLCLHNVFQNANGSGQFLVIGILWELDTNAPDDDFITSLNLANVAGTTVSITDVGLSSLFSWTNSQQKFNYKGGLTTPNCTEAVEWMVVRTIKKINQSQLSLFTNLWANNTSFFGGRGNNRVIQDTNRRQINLIGYSDDDDDYDWVWPVLSVIIALMCVAIFVAVVMTICYCKKTRSEAYAESEPKKNVHNASEVDQVPLENEG